MFRRPIPQVHIAGVGDFPLASVTSLADPFPLPSVDTDDLKLEQYLRMNGRIVVRINICTIWLDEIFDEPSVVKVVPISQSGLDLLILDFQSGEFLDVKSLEEWRNGSQQDTIVMKKKSPQINMEIPEEEDAGGLGSFDQVEDEPVDDSSDSGIIEAISSSAESESYDLDGFNPILNSRASQDFNGS
ncbi:hypothetical protein C5167_013452 [Papaver somniferum]|uniref:Uncharacterized protein n=1 Tax=Papaver somniferum TaxID=3469 RepID=A0A4Y7J3G4_PAPSO|nr:hypothetical protein C5167_013452 [Papaver somniferum]